MEPVNEKAASIGDLPLFYDDTNNEIFRNTFVPYSQVIRPDPTFTIQQYASGSIGFPAGARGCKITATGQGGGGSESDTWKFGGAGGGAGGTFTATLDLTQASPRSLDYYVGGGASSVAVATGDSGTDGLPTVFTLSEGIRVGSSTGFASGGASRLLRREESYLCDRGVRWLRRRRRAHDVKRRRYPDRGKRVHVDHRRGRF